MYFQLKLFLGCLGTVWSRLEERGCWLQLVSRDCLPCRLNCRVGHANFSALPGTDLFHVWLYGCMKWPCFDVLWHDFAERVENVESQSFTGRSQMLMQYNSILCNANAAVEKVEKHEEETKNGRDTRFASAVYNLYEYNFTTKSTWKMFECIEYYFLSTVMSISSAVYYLNCSHPNKWACFCILPNSSKV